MVQGTTEVRRRGTKPKYGEEATVAVLCQMPRELKELVRRKARADSAAAAPGEEVSMSSIVCLATAKYMGFKLPKGVK